MLFYSSRCNYSQEVVSQISKVNLGSIFLQVNVDNGNYNLPPFVDRVPLIYIIASKELVVDDNVLRFVNALHSQLQPVGQQQSQPPSQKQQQQPTGELEYLSDMNKSISNSFSFIQEGDDNITPLGYGFVAQKGNSNDQPGLQPQSMSKGSKMDSAVLENFKTQRDQELACYMPQRSI